MSVPNESRFSVVEKSEDGHCAIVQLTDEDHTLANALRHMIVKNPSVKFCGYSMPHPNEAVVLIQIQTCEDLLALDALRKGFTDLQDSCQHLKTLFERKYNLFVKQK